MKVHVQEARKALDNKLADYPATRFRDVRATIHDPNPAIAAMHLQFAPGADPNAPLEVVFCGELNAKNAMGAYVGWQLFAVTDDGYVFLDDKADEFCGAGHTFFGDYTAVLTFKR